MTKSINRVSIEALRLIENASPEFKTVTEMEAPIAELEARAKIMYRIIDDMDDDEGLCVYRLARDVAAATEKLADIHSRLFKMTHPNRALVARREAEARRREAKERAA